MFLVLAGERSERGARPSFRGTRLGRGEGQQSPADVRCDHEAHQGSQGTVPRTSLALFSFVGGSLKSP